MRALMLSTMFSLDNGREKRFLTRSRLFGGGEVCLVQPRG